MLYTAAGAECAARGNIDAMVIDFHSHILPEMDDGAKDLNMSVRMLRMTAEQGVQVQILSPHFYPWREKADSFLRRREEAMERLWSVSRDWWPVLLLGAEVAYVRGISELELEELCIEDTRVLMLELPFESWDGAVTDDIASLTLDRGYSLILAHVERYMRYKGNRELLSELAQLPLTVQMNAEAFIEHRTRRGALSLAEEYPCFILGSDAHGLESRVPDLEQGRKLVESKLGHAALRRVDRTGEALLDGVFVKE